MVFSGLELSGNDAYGLGTDKKLSNVIRNLVPTSLIASSSTSSLSQAHQGLHTKVRNNGLNNEGFVQNSKALTGDLKHALNWLQLVRSGYNWMDYKRLTDRYNAFQKGLPKRENYEKDKRSYSRALRTPLHTGDRTYRSDNSPLEEYKLLRYFLGKFYRI